MPSTAVDLEDTRPSDSLEETTEKGITSNGSADSFSRHAVPPSDHTQRTLKSRHIQLIGRNANLSLSQP